MIVVVDYGVGNAGALVNMLEFIGCEARVSADRAQIETASHLILPGVGAFDAAMQRLFVSGLIPILERQAFEKGVPLLGVCLGMQILGRSSAEGKERGLGWIAADAMRLSPDARFGLRVPHIGWAPVVPKVGSRLFGSTTERRFYFSHSYYMSCADHSDVGAEYDYGGAITCAIEHQNLFGVQFHPEKSHREGMRLLQKFADIRSQ